MQIESLNDNEIIMEYNGEKYKIIPIRSNSFGSGSQYVLEYELINPTLEYFTRDSKKTLRFKDDLFYNKEDHCFELISSKHNKFNNIENIVNIYERRIESKNDKFKYHIKFYHAYLSLGNNFTKNGLIIKNENVFKVFKELDNEALLKLKNIFIEKDHQFIMDVYKNKDINRKYKIFYENECIEIKEEESKEEIKKESEESPKKESEEESKKETKPATAKIQPQESDDDDKIISDFSDNSVDESED